MRKIQYLNDANVKIQKNQVKSKKLSVITR